MKRILGFGAVAVCLGALWIASYGCKSYRAYVLVEPAGRQVVAGGGPVEMNGFSVNAPPGQKWGMEVDGDRRTVTFFCVKRHSRGGQLLGYILVQAYRNTLVAPEMQGIKEREVARIFRDQEIRALGEAGIPVTDVKKEEITRAGRNLYALSYKTTRLRYKILQIENIPVVSENLFLLYFPPDFKDRHDFYGFVISDACRPASLATSADVEQVYPVLQSLKIASR